MVIISFMFYFFLGKRYFYFIIVNSLINSFHSSFRFLVSIIVPEKPPREVVNKICIVLYCRYFSFIFLSLFSNYYCIIIYALYDLLLRIFLIMNLSLCVLK